MKTVIKQRLSRELRLRDFAPHNPHMSVNPSGSRGPQLQVTADLGFFDGVEPSASVTNLGCAVAERADSTQERNPDAPEDEDDAITPEKVYGW